jgi:hypothetical protein
VVRSKNALNTMMMSYIALGFVGVLWALIGYSLAFTTGTDWLGDMSNVFLKGVGTEALGTIPHVLHMSYQATFCIITAALISGAIVERMRFSAVRGRSSRSGRSSSTRRSRTGCGAAAGWRRWRRSTSPAARSCTSTPAWRRW